MTTVEPEYRSSCKACGRDLKKRTAASLGAAECCCRAGYCLGFCPMQVPAFRPSEREAYWAQKRAKKTRRR